MSPNERKFMQAAINASLKSAYDPQGRTPRVGAVAVIHGEQVAEAYRGEFEPGQHAEYVLLEKHLPDKLMSDATVYTTLEPCTERGEGKVPCFQRLIDRRVGRVVIGMLDPNPIVRGLGFRKLRLANIRTDIFPNDLMSQIEDINRDFIRAIEHNPVHQSTQEIAVLSVKSRHPLQFSAINRTLDSCLEELRRIRKGQIPIPGKEAGYFRRWLELVESYPEPENVKAYIRLSAFEPGELLGINWFNEFYERLKELVKSGKVTIKYIFLLRSRQPVGPVVKFLDSFKSFASEIRTVDDKGSQLAPEELRPSIVLFQKQRVAFTHDRADNTALLEASEHIGEKEFERLKRRFHHIEMASTVYFKQ